MSRISRGVRIGIRALLLTMLLGAGTWMTNWIINYFSPFVVTASQHQFEDSNEAFARSRALATADPSILPMFISSILFILIWAAAGWQWWKLAQEENNAS